MSSGTPLRRMTSIANSSSALALALKLLRYGRSR